MVHFTKLAVLVAMAMQPFYSMGTSDLNQNQFEQLIKKIPNDSVREKIEGLYESKNYSELEYILLDYVDEYVESSFAGEDKEAIEKSKESLKEMIDTFLEKKSFEKELLEIESSPMSIVSDFVKEMQSPEKQAEAAELLSEGTYTKLADLIYDYIDEMELGDSEKDEILASVDPAIQDLIMKSFGDAEEENEEDDTPMGTVNAFINGMTRNKEEAKNLAKEEKYSNLEDLVYEYLDQTEMDLGEKHTMLMSVHSAIQELITEQRKKEEDELVVEDVEDDEDDEESSEEFEDEEESSEKDDVIDLQKVVNDIPDEDKRAEVQELLGNRNYKELQYTLEEYIDSFDGISESGKEDFKNNVDDAIIAMRFEYNEFEEGSHYEVDLTLQEPVIDVTELIEEMKDEEERARARMFYDEKQYHELQDVLAGHIFSLDHMEESEREELLKNMESASETLIENDRKSPEYVVSDSWKKLNQAVTEFIDENLSGKNGTNATEVKKQAKFLLGRKYFAKLEDYAYAHINMGDTKHPGDVSQKELDEFAEWIGDLIEMDEGMIGNTESDPKFQPITVKLKNGVSNKPVQLEDMVEGVDYFEIDEKEEVHLSELTDLIVEIPDNEVQGDAFDLLHNKKYSELEEHLYSYLDDYIDGLEAGDIKQNMLNHKAEIRKKIDVAIKYQTNKANGVFEDEEDEAKEQLLEVDGYRAFAFNQAINSIPDKEIRDSMIEKIKSENYDEAEIMFKEYLNTYLSQYEPYDSDNTWGNVELLSEYISDVFKRMAEKRAEPEPEFMEEDVNADEDEERRMNENEFSDESDEESDSMYDMEDGLDMGFTNEDTEMEKNLLLEDMKDDEVLLSEPELREHVKTAIGRIAQNDDRIDELITSFISSNIED